MGFMDSVPWQPHTVCRPSKKQLSATARVRCSAASRDTIAGLGQWLKVGDGERGDCQLQRRLDMSAAGVRTFRGRADEHGRREGQRALLARRAWKRNHTIKGASDPPTAPPGNS